MEEPNIKLNKNIDQPFGWCPVDIINDPEISLKAKGLWLYMNSKPDGWNFSASRMAKQCSDGRDSIRSGLQELIQKGYLKAIKKGDGRVEYTLLSGVFHNSTTPKTENPFLGVEPKTENPTVGKPHDGKIRPISNKEDKQERVIERKSELEQNPNTGSDAGLAGSVPASILKMSRTHYEDETQFEKDFYNRNTFHMNMA